MDRETFKLLVALTDVISAMAESHLSTAEMFSTRLNLVQKQILMLCQIDSFSDAEDARRQLAEIAREVASLGSDTAFGDNLARLQTLREHLSAWIENLKSSSGTPPSSDS